ncbi:MAG: Ig-like domain-containing protein [Clostridia bacterium]|nr:Ig-like domain-containing protein [Clostridia bacterium]
MFKGTARYDGGPAIAEAFVVQAINGASVTVNAVTFDPDKANSVESITLNTQTASIAGTGTVQLYAYTAPGTGSVTWASGTSAKATVSSTGLVTGVTAGTSVITATCNGKTASCTVTVT